MGGQKYNLAMAAHIAQTKVVGGSYLQKYQAPPPQPQFKPLVQVDPTLLTSTRNPLQNPRPGDYLLKQTASTEGIASKKSLELKKRYLLGEPANGNKIQKSGSTSVLDSKIRSFQSNISECQKLLNPGNDISPSMKNFLDRTKLGENSSNELMRSATTNILNDLRVEITIQKATSAMSTENEKENVFVNSKNELNKGMEYSETVNTTLLESMSKKSPPTPTNQTIIETINLVTPEKQTPIIDLTNVEIPTKMLASNVEFINSMTVENVENTSANASDALLNADSNRIIDLTCDSPVKSDRTVIDDIVPDVSKDVKESIPDILGHIEKQVTCPRDEEHQLLLSNGDDEEKRDSPEKLEEQYENDTLQIQVPNIPWSTRKTENMSSTTTGSSCSSNSSSVEDIQHYILESTTSPDTNTSGLLAGAHKVPRVEVHDTTGNLMQIDSLMIIDGKYIGDPEDLKFLEIPEGVIVPELPAVRTSEVEDEAEADVEPVTATPEPPEQTVIELASDEPLPPLPEQGPPLPERGPPKVKPFNLKFDTRNENKIESLKSLPLVVEQTAEHTKAIKPVSLNLSKTQTQTKPTTPGTPTAPIAAMRTPTSPNIDYDKTPTAELLSRGSDSETEATGTGQVLTETELSDWTADDCISENFVDMEFVLNSNKGTIKRNKKGKKKLSSTKLPSTSEILKEVAKTAPVAEFEGILKSIDIDDIEFMDTGSEGSCAEAYSATNTALLHNRGYMEFIETTAAKSPKQTPSHKVNQTAVGCAHASTAEKYRPVVAKRDEKLGIDYIEQGAYIMQAQEEDLDSDLLKTPVNEDVPSASAAVMSKSQAPPLPTAMTQSLTDSSTLNDLDDDSLGLVTGNSQAQISSSITKTTTTTTEESDALTVVTSPLDDSSSPKLPAEPMAVSNSIAGNSASKNAADDGSTPSSSDKNPKTSQSTGAPSSTSTALSSKATPSRQSSHELSASHNSASAANANVNPTSSATPRKPSEELSYEEYVRALQQKITQISTARDSLDTRKQRRKSSKGEAPTSISNNVQTVIAQAPQKLHLAVADDTAALPPTTTTADPTALCTATTIHKVPEIPTLTSKLEEITKERTKQKDLIHDLVMDKLQSKKQLNAEKRLHRSRQRNMLTSGYNSGGSSLSPTPKLAAAATTSDTNCTNQAHYHVSTAAKVTTDVIVPVEIRAHAQRLLAAPVATGPSYSFKENNPLQKSPTYISAYSRVDAMSPTRTYAYKQRPFSEHLDPEQLDAFERYKLSKTSSFSYATTKPPRIQSALPAAGYGFATPLAPTRHNRGAHIGVSALVTPSSASKEPFSASTENLRSEARARARLKSNSELGLSPEEKMMARKRLQVEHLNGTPKFEPTPAIIAQQVHLKSKDAALSARDRKMSASKSVNDLVYIAAQLQRENSSATHADENSNTKPTAAIADFMSDPNILLSSTAAQANVKYALKSGKLASSSSASRRQKEPERRKSLIQSLSSFFHKNSKESASGGGGGGLTAATASASAANSAQPERPGTSGSSTTTGTATTSSSGGGGADSSVFSRFRISPKSKEKSKSCFDVRNIGFGDKDGYPPPASHERSNSQDCILKLQQHQHQQHTTTNNTGSNHSNKYHNNNNKKSSSSAFSSSSPQLFANKSIYLATAASTATADEQTPPPIPPLPLNYQRSDDESYGYATETRGEQKKQRAISKAVRQAELKRLRIAQEIQREQEEIEVQLKELEARGVHIEKALRGEAQNGENLETSNNIGSSDEKLLKELLEIWRNITQLKKRDEELGIRQRELQLEHRHAQLKEELNLRLSSNKLDKSSADVAAEGAILNEMLEIVAKRAALRPNSASEMASTSAAAAAAARDNTWTAASSSTAAAAVATAGVGGIVVGATTSGDCITLKNARGQSFNNDESII